jgi:hypothetical protein
MKLICTKCKDEKSTDDFNKKKSKKSGFDCWCKECRKKYRIENKSRIKAWSKSYYVNRKPILSERRKNNYSEIIKEERARYYRRKETGYPQKKSKKYREKHHEKLLEYGKKYRNDNKGILSEKKKIYHRKNTENRRRKYYENREMELAKRRQNRHLDRARYQKWRIANPEKYRIRNKIGNARRRAYLLSVGGGKVTQNQILELVIIQKNKCYWCDKEMIKYTLDHFEPLSKGGANDITNIVLACGKCNCSKNNKSPYEFSEQMAKQTV